MASTWGNNTWGSNEWSDDTVTINPTGQLATSSIGSLEAFNEEGWGRQEWGNSGWGVEYAVSLSGQQATSSTVFYYYRNCFTLNRIIFYIQFRFSYFRFNFYYTFIRTKRYFRTWNFDNAGTLVGWGRNGWGEEPYGDSFNKLVQPAGLSSTSSVGSLTSAIQNFVFPTGVAATSSVGSLTLNLTSVITPTGVSCNFQCRSNFSNRNEYRTNGSQCNFNSWWNNFRCFNRINFLQVNKQLLRQVI